MEAKIEEDIDLDNQYKIKNLPKSISIREAASQNCVDTLFNDLIITKKDTDINFNDKKNRNNKIR